MSDLFSPINAGCLTLPNRILMAPLTRCRADGEHVPGPLIAEYYAQRAMLRADSNHPDGLDDPAWDRLPRHRGDPTPERERSAGSGG